MDKKLNIKFDVPPSCLERWNRSIMARASDDEDEDEEKRVNINIYSTIGEYGDGSGMTAKIVSSILRKAEGKPVTVNINSGGGDFFEGLAIYSLLSEYEGDVTVKVLGLAASAASIIAMSGKKIQVAKSGFIMIHNAWTIALGNKDDMKEVANMLAKFDKSMAELYSRKTGIEQKEVEKMMAAETWLAGDDAVELSFAHALLDSDEITVDENEKDTPSALKKIDVALAKAGVPRSERRAMIKELTATPCAGETVTPCADKTKAALAALIETLKL